MTDKSERTVNMGERPANTMKVNKPREMKFQMQWRIGDNAVPEEGRYDESARALEQLDLIDEITTFYPHSNGINISYKAQTNSSSKTILLAIMETEAHAPELELIGIDFDLEE